MRRPLGIALAGTAAAALAVASMVVPAAASGVPGLTPTSVTLGAIVTQSGFGTADFPAFLAGLKAYQAYVNSLGGINHRKFNLAYTLDDQSNSLQNITDAQQLVLTDHVFAVFVSSIFFGGHTFLAGQHTPTYGYVTDSNWAGPNNFYGDYGSLLNFSSTTPDFAFVAKKTNSLRAALIAYSVPQSQNICQPALNTFKSKYGITVAYSDLSVNPIIPNFSADIIKMKAAKVNLVINCMDFSGGLGLNQQLKAYGMSPVQVWLDGYDRSVVKNSHMLPKTYFILQHVPFEAAKTFPTAYPGLNLYLKWMVKSGNSKHTYDDVALMGWEAANLFARGLKAAGASPTQASVVTATNKITNDTGGGVATPTNWTSAHTKNTSPSCVTYVVDNLPGTTSASFKQVYNVGKNPWICYPLTGIINVLKPVKAPAGSPGT
jgi:ABC-type branched-subunit amino acid transport system substrate-binding protein